MKAICVAVLMLISASGIALGQKPRPCGEGDTRLLPVDEASSQPDFFTFRAHLQTAVAERNVDVLVASLDPHIRVGFDGSGGVDGFTKFHLGDRAERFWRSLGAVLALGGTFRTPDTFVAPYTFSRWPDRLDSFACAAILGADVRLRTRPQPNAPASASVSFSIVQLLGTRSDTNEWYRVQLGDGRTGYVWHTYVRSPVDYRAIFTRSGGRWRMTAFVAGD